jgi:hypothetical protein
MHTAHFPHYQTMISTSPYPSTFQPIYPPKNTHTSTQHIYSSPAATPLQYPLSNTHSLPAIKHPNSSFQITPLFNTLPSLHCSNSPSHKPSFTNPQAYPTTTHPPPLTPLPRLHSYTLPHLHPFPHNFNPSDYIKSTLPTTNTHFTITGTLLWTNTHLTTTSTLPCS